VLPPVPFRQLLERAEEDSLLRDRLGPLSVCFVVGIDDLVRNFLKVISLIDLREVENRCRLRRCRWRILRDQFENFEGTTLLGFFPVCRLDTRNRNGIFRLLAEDEIQIDPVAVSCWDCPGRCRPDDNRSTVSIDCDTRADCHSQFLVLELVVGDRKSSNDTGSAD